MKKADKKRKRWTGLMALVLTGILCLSFLSPVTVRAEESWPETPALQSQAAVVMDMENGVVLYEKNPDEKHYPASITKLMTALVAVENSDLDEKVTFSEKAVFGIERGSSSIARDVGEVMTMEQCLYGMLLESANECAMAIAEHVGGGEIKNFVSMMNTKAKELGCKNTHFVNPSGLHDPDHYTTPYDMALIASAAYKDPIVAKIVGTRQYQIPPTNKHDTITPLNNHHKMLNFYKTSHYLCDYCVGGKTGYTTQANNTLVTFAIKNDMKLCSVIMDCPSGGAEYIDTRTLLDKAYEDFTEYQVGDSMNLVQEDLTGKLGQNIRLLEIGNGTITLPKTADLSSAESEIRASKKQGKECAGQIEYTYAGKTVGGADLLYTEEESQTYPFHNLSREEGGKGEAYLRIDFTLILLLVLIGAGAIVAVFFIRRAVKIHEKRHPRRPRLYQVNTRHYPVIRKRYKRDKRH